MNILMNPWTITIIGGVVVGIIIHLITKQNKVNRNKGKQERTHIIEVGKDAVIETDGSLTAGDQKSDNKKPKEHRHHKLIVDRGGKIDAKDDVVSGDS